MNSGAPASTPPPDFSSLGIIVSQSAMSVAYCDAGKHFGEYFPAGAAAFSLCTIWWTYSAAAAGITCSNELLAAPKARVRRMSRREMESFMGGPHDGRKQDLTQRARREERFLDSGRKCSRPPLGMTGFDCVAERREGAAVLRPYKGWRRPDPVGINAPAGTNR